MRGIRIGRISIFLVLTFALTWGFNLLVTLTIGQSAYLNLGVSPLGMLFPAFTALILQIFIFKDSPLHYQNLHGSPRWIIYGYLGVTISYTGFTLIGIFFEVRPVIFQGISSLLITLWTLLVLFIGSQSERNALKDAGLQLGDTGLAVKFLVGVVLFFIIQSGLNLIFGYSSFLEPADQVYGISIPGNLYPLALILGFILAVTGIPLSGLAVTFGEEYGWRGFLQNQLEPIGRRAGVMIIGLIWGIWHFPIILSGVHTYPPTVLGLFLGLIFFILWGFVQSYAVLKTRSIWVAAFLHGLVNSLFGYTRSYIEHPDDVILSFGLGIYGLICLFIVVIFILRDPIWRDSEYDEVTDGKRKNIL